MAADILTPKIISSEATFEHRYKLSESDLQTIIQQSPFAKMVMKIERQRRVFIEKNGSAFGLETSGVGSD